MQRYHGNNIVDRYKTGLIPTLTSLAPVEQLAASTFCRCGYLKYSRLCCDYEFTTDADDGFQW